MADATIAVDKLTAIALDYNGCGEIVRVENFGSKQVFYSSAKRFDREAVITEMKDEKVTVYRYTEDEEVIDLLPSETAQDSWVWDGIDQEESDD
jgi:hypothetical protein